jgi:hypothetical protein
MRTNQRLLRPNWAWHKTLTADRTDSSSHNDNDNDNVLLDHLQGATTSKRTGSKNMQAEIAMVTERPKAGLHADY